MITLIFVRFSFSKINLKPQPFSKTSTIWLLPNSKLKSKSYKLITNENISTLFSVSSLLIIELSTKVLVLEPPTKWYSRKKKTVIFLKLPCNHVNKQCSKKFLGWNRPYNLLSNQPSPFQDSSLQNTYPTPPRPVSPLSLPSDLPIKTFWCSVFVHSSHPNQSKLDPVLLSVSYSPNQKRLQML